MKITIYELLGLVKDGKAPKKIKYKYNFYEYNSNQDDYMPTGLGECGVLDELLTFAQLDDKVEIIEDKKIEKLFNCEMESKNGEITILVANINDLKDKINEIIEVLNDRN